MKVFIDNEDLIDCVRETVDDMFGKVLERAVNHALHYFFRTKDMIEDFLPAFSFVDDMLVIDTALELLTNEPP